MLRTFSPILVAALIAAAPAQAAGKDQEYRGVDAGCLVYSVGTIKIGMKFTFPYNRTETVDHRAAKDWAGKIEPKVGGAIYLKVKNPDFSGDETGHVVVRCLPPGLYRVGDFSFHGFVPGVASYTWSLGHPSLMSFHIKSGEATYIGSFMRAPSLGTPLQPTLGAAGFFVVADRSGRDLPIASRRLPAAMRVTKEVTDVSKFNSPALRTSQPS